MVDQIVVGHVGSIVKMRGNQGITGLINQESFAARFVILRLMTHFIPIVQTIHTITDRKYLFLWVLSIALNILDGQCG